MIDSSTSSRMKCGLSWAITFNGVAAAGIVGACVIVSSGLPQPRRVYRLGWMLQFPSLSFSLVAPRSFYQLGGESRFDIGRKRKHNVSPGQKLTEIGRPRRSLPPTNVPGSFQRSVVILLTVFFCCCVKTGGGVGGIAQRRARDAQCLCVCVCWGLSSQSPTTAQSCNALINTSEGETYIYNYYYYYHYIPVQLVPGTMARTSFVILLLAQSVVVQYSWATYV